MEAWPEMEKGPTVSVDVEQPYRRITGSLAVLSCKFMVPCASDPGRSHREWERPPQVRGRQIHHAERTWAWRLYLVDSGRVWEGREYGERRGAQREERGKEGRQRLPLQKKSGNRERERMETSLPG